jgi:hypothetical protein
VSAGVVPVCAERFTVANTEIVTMLNPRMLL